MNVNDPLMTRPVASTINGVFKVRRTKVNKKTTLMDRQWQVIRKVLKGLKVTQNPLPCDCDAAFLRERFESQFLPGMTWDNYGKWQIDHIKPRSAFKDHNDPASCAECNHWTNLRPLWAIDNTNKGKSTGVRS